MKKLYWPNGTVREATYYVTKTFVRVLNGSGTHDFTYVYVDGQLVAQRSNGTTLFIHGNHEGSSSVITDSSGAVVEETTYTPFGEVLSGGTKTRYGYEGMEHDSVVGDTDFHFRKYKPEWGLFTQPDTLISSLYDPQMLNRRSFERNNPYRYIDPTGHIGIGFTGGGGVAALTEGGAFSTGRYWGWTPSRGFQSGWVSTEAYINDPYTGKQGFGIAETSGNFGFVIFTHNLEELKGKSRVAGIGASLKFLGAQIEWSESLDSTYAESLSFTWSPGYGIDLHYYPTAQSYVHIFNPSPIPVVSDQASPATQGSGGGRRGGGGGGGGRGCGHDMSCPRGTPIPGSSANTGDPRPGGGRCGENMSCQ